METSELRIPAKPQLWLWWLNGIIQLPLGAMIIKAAVAGAGSVASRAFVGLLGVVCLALWCFSLHVLRRLRGEPLHVVVGATHLEVPSMVRRASVVVP